MSELNDGLDEFDGVQDAHILITDDDESYFDLVDTVLKNIGVPLTTEHAVDGNDLLDYLNADGKYSAREKFPRPDLILLDLYMPNKDGLEVLQELQVSADFRDIPVIMLTKETDEAMRKKAIDFGAKDCISKPDSTKELKKVLKVLINHWIESMTDFEDV